MIHSLALSQPGKEIKHERVNYHLLILKLTMLTLRVCILSLLAVVNLKSALWNFYCKAFLGYTRALKNEKFNNLIRKLTDKIANKISQIWHGETS